MEERADGSGLIHFKDFHRKFDGWLRPDSGRVRQFGPHRVVPKGRASRTSARKVSNDPERQHVRQIALLSSR